MVLIWNGTRLISIFINRPLRRVPSKLLWLRLRFQTLRLGAVPLRPCEQSCPPSAHTQMLFTHEPAAGAGFYLCSNTEVRPHRSTALPHRSCRAAGPSSAAARPELLRSPRAGGPRRPHEQWERPQRARPLPGGPAPLAPERFLPSSSGAFPRPRDARLPSELRRLSPCRPGRRGFILPATHPRTLSPSAQSVPQGERDGRAGSRPAALRAYPGVGGTAYGSRAAALAALTSSRPACRERSRREGRQRRAAPPGLQCAPLPFRGRCCARRAAQHCSPLTPRPRARRAAEQSPEGGERTREARSAAPPAVLRPLGGASLSPAPLGAAGPILLPQGRSLGAALPASCRGGGRSAPLPARLGRVRTAAAALPHHAREWRDATQPGTATDGTERAEPRTAPSGAAAPFK